MTDIPEPDWSPEKDKAQDKFQEEAQKYFEKVAPLIEKFNKGELGGLSPPQQTVLAAPRMLPIVTVRMIDNGWIVGFWDRDGQREIYVETKAVGDIVQAACQELDRQCVEEKRS